MRSEESLELLRIAPKALNLAYVIARRARWREGFNQHGLEQGEAMLGDFQSYGMTEQEYRTAKKQLTKWQFATFRPTPDGTIGKLSDSRLFSTSVAEPNGQCNGPGTNHQRPRNGHATTNEERNKNGTKKGIRPNKIRQRDGFIDPSTL